MTIRVVRTMLSSSLLCGLEESYIDHPAIFTSMCPIGMKLGEVSETITFSLVMHHCYLCLIWLSKYEPIVIVCHNFDKKYITAIVESDTYCLEYVTNSALNF